MTYSDIVQALPKNVADTLQSKLDAAQIDHDSTSGEALAIIQEVVAETKSEIAVGAEVRGMVDMLLDQLPRAAVQALYGV